jgi:hypothetical protein
MFSSPPPIYLDSTADYHTPEERRTLQIHLHRSRHRPAYPLPRHLATNHIRILQPRKRLRPKPPQRSTDMVRLGASLHNRKLDHTDRDNLLLHLALRSLFVHGPDDKHWTQHFHQRLGRHAEQRRGRIAVDAGLQETNHTSKTESHRLETSS